MKLAFFQELVAQALETDTIRDKLDEYVEERQALAATRRDEALDEGRKKREEKERRKFEATPKKEVKLSEGNHSMPNGVISENMNDKVYTRKKNHSSVHSQHRKRLELIVFYFLSNDILVYELNDMVAISQFFFFSFSSIAPGKCWRTVRLNLGTTYLRRIQRNRRLNPTL